MEQRQAEQLLMVNSTKLQQEYLHTIHDLLLKIDYNTAVMLFSDLKDPTIVLILSILIGCYGIDRFYIGDVGLGVGKLITLGGCLVWWFIDLFFIMDATRKKNTERVLQALTINTRIMQNI